MASYSGMSDGYGAAGFSVDNGLPVPAWWDSLEVHVSPERLKIVVTLAGGKAYPRKGEWYGPDAVAVGAAVCSGHMPAAVLADFCDEHEPTSADRDLNAGYRLRRAV